MLKTLQYFAMITTVVLMIMLVVSGKNVDEVPQPIIILYTVLFVYVIACLIINKD